MDTDIFEDTAGDSLKGAKKTWRNSIDTMPTNPGSEISDRPWRRCISREQSSLKCTISVIVFTGCRKPEADPRCITYFWFLGTRNRRPILEHTASYVRLCQCIAMDNSIHDVDPSWQTWLLVSSEWCIMSPRCSCWVCNIGHIQYPMHIDKGMPVMLHSVKKTIHIFQVTTGERFLRRTFVISMITNRLFNSVNIFAVRMHLVHKRWSFSRRSTANAT